MRVATGAIGGQRSANPDHLVVGQEPLIPYVTYRHRVQLGDTKTTGITVLRGPTMSEVFEIPNGAAQRDLIVGEWLLIPDLANASGHTVVAGETFGRWPNVGTAIGSCGRSSRS